MWKSKRKKKNQTPLPLASLKLPFPSLPSPAPAWVRELIRLNTSSLGHIHADARGNREDETSALNNDLVVRRKQSRGSDALCPWERGLHVLVNDVDPDCTRELRSDSTSHLQQRLKTLPGDDFHTPSPSLLSPSFSNLQRFEEL